MEASQKNYHLHPQQGIYTVQYYLAMDNFTIKDSTIIKNFERSIVRANLLTFTFMHDWLL